MKHRALVFMTFLSVFLVASTAQSYSITPTFVNDPGPNYLQNVLGFGDQFYFKYEPVVDGTENGVTIDVRETAMGPVFDFWSTIQILAVLVKGGPDALLYDYRPEGVSADTGLHAPLNLNSGKYYGLSHIEFGTGAPVPEPTTIVLLGLGLIGLGALGRKKMR